MSGEIGTLLVGDYKGQPLLELLASELPRSLAAGRQIERIEVSRSYAESPAVKAGSIEFNGGDGFRSFPVTVSPSLPAGHALLVWDVTRVQVIEGLGFPAPSAAYDPPQLPEGAQLALGL